MITFGRNFNITDVITNASINNMIVYSECLLNFDGHKIITKYPLLMIELVKILRNKFGDDIIQKNAEEISKYEQIMKEREFINNCNEIQGIINEFSNEPTKFEDFCADLYKKMGYKTKVTAKTGDGGYDIVMNYNNKKYIVECKCYDQKHSIGRPMIQKLVGANQEAKADNMIFITKSNFSKDAIVFAKTTNVELIDGDKLLELFNKYYEKDTKQINVSRSQWQLNKIDLQKHYPPDVYM